MSNARDVVRRALQLTVLAAAGLCLHGCSGGGGGENGGGGAEFTVGGTVTGLTGSGLVLRNNGGDDLAITQDGAFTFPTKLAAGAAYTISVLTQPSAPAQTCTPSQAAGTVAANVTGALVTCVTATATGSAIVGPAGGTVDGHYGARMVVPAGALASTLTLGLARDSTDAPAFAVEEVGAVGAPYALTPHGTTFSAPVTVRIPFDPAQVPAGETPVLYKAEVGGSFAALPTTVDGNFLETTVTSFSWVLPAAAATRPRVLYAVQAAGTSTPREVASFPIHRATGALSAPTSTAPVGEAPISVVVHPSGRFLYVSHGGATTVNGISPASIATYRLSPVNGQILGLAAGATGTGAIAGQHEPVLPVVHPSGKFLYVVNHGRSSASGGDVAVMAIDGTTGVPSTATSVANGAGSPPTGLAFDRLGTRAYVTYVWTPNTPQGNTFYDTVKVYNVDPATGLFSAPIGSAAAGNNPWAAARDVNDRFVHVASLGTNEVRTYAIGSGGALT